MADRHHPTATIRPTDRRPGGPPAHLPTCRPSADDGRRWPTAATIHRAAKAAAPVPFFSSC